MIFFLFFSRKQDLTFHANCGDSLHEMSKCQILFSGGGGGGGKEEEGGGSPICHQLKILRSWQSVNIWYAEFTISR